YALINDSFRNAFINMLRPFFGPCTKYIAVSPPQQTHTTFSFAQNATRRGDSPMKCHNQLEAHKEAAKALIVNYQ
ncbi:neuropeptide F receptor, partial [Aphelenchoides avenae]